MASPCFSTIRSNGRCLYLSNCLMTWNFSRLLCLQHVYLYSWCHSSISKLLCRQEIWNDVKAVSFKGFIVYEITDSKRKPLAKLFVVTTFFSRFIALWNQVHYYLLYLRSYLNINVRVFWITNSQTWTSFGMQRVPFDPYLWPIIKTITTSSTKNVNLVVSKIKKY